jgi:hypothetical protein
MVESMILTSYPAFISGVEIARIPNGAVASMLENDGTKKTIFLEDFTRLPLGLLLLFSDKSVERFLLAVEIRADQNTHPRQEATSAKRRICRHVVNLS